MALSQLSLEDLQRALATALADVEAERKAREAADTRAEAERQAREAADTRAEAERQAREAADTRAEEQAKLRFFSSMRGMAAYASQRGGAPLSSSSDHVRVNLPRTEVVQDFVSTMFANLSKEEVGLRWQAFLELFYLWEPPQTTDGAFERRNVHPVLNAMVDAAQPPISLWRVWSEVLVSDSLDADEMEPDVTLTSKLESAPSALVAVGYGEWKRPPKPGHGGGRYSLAAAQQSRNYARRGVLRLTEEADDRRDDASQIQMIAFGSCGHDIVFSRVSSGAPPVGTSFCDATPFPSQQSQPLPLLAGWDFVSTSWRPPAEPPEGFAALARMLSTPRDRLVATIGPLQSLVVQWSPKDTSLQQAASNAPQHNLPLGDCLGAGGTSDVYRLGCSFTTSGGVTVQGDSAVVKVPRAATASVCESYKAEVKALVALATGHAADSAVLPKLLACGARCVHRAGAPVLDRVPWPVLLMAPAGERLASMLQAHSVGKARPSGAGAGRRARRAFADAVAADVLAALRHAHGCGVVHCDVRPENIVWTDGRAVLVDWGLACNSGTRLRCWGTRAFADDRIFVSDKGLCASRQVDVVALVYTWLAIVHGHRGTCRPPWLREAGAEAADLFTARDKWLRITSSHYADVTFLAKKVRRLRAGTSRVWADDGGIPGDGLYDFIGRIPAVPPQPFV